MKRPTRTPAVVLAAAAAILAGGAGFLAAGGLPACGPFTDVTLADPFCPFVLEIFDLGITTGTTPTTYSPSQLVTRLQMSAFLSRTVDALLKRSSPRSAADRYWTPKEGRLLGLTTVGLGPQLVECDGTDVWVANFESDSVSRVRAGDGKLLETWTGAISAFTPVAAMGRILVTGQNNPGQLYRIDPTLPAGVVTTVATNLGIFPTGLSFDGARFWTANQANFAASVSIVTPAAAIPWTVTTVAAGFSGPVATLYDGANVWVVDAPVGKLLKLDANAVVLQTVTVGTNPGFPVFDGTNIWVPGTGSNNVTVVRASSGAILATLTGNGLKSPSATAFDGQRVLVTNFLGPSVSLWKAADLTAAGTFLTGPATGPYGAASDGRDFWITFLGTNRLARF